MSEAESAQRRAEELRARAAAARVVAARMENEASAWEAGAAGERRVAAVLATLGTRVEVLHDRLLRPGQSKANLDHIVVSTAGVFLVDAKNWAGTTSVHEGNLWQHRATGSTGPKHDPKHTELDKVSRAAALMERVLGGPVVPMIALAGQQEARFEATRVRGVEVVPISGLAQWLSQQPRLLTPVQIASLRNQIEIAFPPATGQAVMAPARPAASSGSKGLRSRPHRSRTVRKKASRPRILAPIAGIGLLLWTMNGGMSTAQSWLARASSSFPAASPSGSPSSGASAAKPLTLLDGTPAPGKPCQGLSSVAVQEVLGHDVIEQDSSLSHDVCGWHLDKPANQFVPPDLAVRSGYTAQAAVRAQHLTTATSSAAMGSATILVPQHTAVPGSTVAPANVTQPFEITYRYTYPHPTTRESMQAADADAAKKVAELAQRLAVRLPQGDGADDTNVHFGG